MTESTAAAIAARIRAVLPTCYTAHAALYAGDHWRQGAGWVGPRPAERETGYSTVMDEIRRAFISANKIREVVWRHQAAVVGTEPAWAFVPARQLADGETPTPEEQALIDEAEAALTAWWDGRGVIGTVQQAVVFLLLSGQTALRLFVPEGRLETRADGTTAIPTAPDLATALGYLWLLAPDPTQAAVIVNERTMQETGLYTATVDQQEIAELVALASDGRTAIQIVTPDGPQEPVFLPLGGRLTMARLTAEALITDSVVSQQDLLNMALTMLGRNVVQGGFLERVLLNAQLPGAFETDSAGVEHWVPDPLTVGAGTTNALIGVPIKDAIGNVTGYTTPDVRYRDPVSPDTFERTRQIAYAGILEECRQLHALTTNDGSLSGESRKQARAEFESSLGPTQTTVEHALRWLLETALTMAAVFLGEPERYAGLRASVTCRIETGPIAPDDQAAVRENVKAGILSEETGMGRLGVDDPDAEKARIDAERAARMTRAPQIAPALPSKEPANGPA